MPVRLARLSAWSPRAARGEAARVQSVRGRPLGSAAAAFCGLVLLLLPHSLAAQSLTEAGFAALLMPEQLVQAERAGSLDTTKLDAWLDLSSDETHLGPVHTFIKAEVLRARGDGEQAADLYWKIVGDAAGDPNGDTWGHSALVAPSLYRWLQFQQKTQKRDKAAFRKIARWANDLLSRRLVRSIFESHSILPSLPLFEAEIYKALASVASLLDLPAAAAQYYLNYLSHLRSEEPTSPEDPLYKLTIAQGVATPDRIALFRGRQLLSLGNKRAAVPYLEQALAQGDDEVSLEAQYLLVQAGKWHKRSEKAEKYEEVHRFSSKRELAQDALYQKALLYGGDDPELKENLTRLIREYPGQTRADDAMYWLARSAQVRGRLDESLDWYRQVREFLGQTQYREQSYLRPALGLIWRGQPGDRDEANRILTDFVAEYPDALLRPNALFWLGRIAEDRNEEDVAKKLFQHCAGEEPFGYYGIRAQMHLADGSEARRQIEIENQTLRQQLVAAHRDEAPTEPPGEAKGNVYLGRLRAALDTGLYSAALGGEAALRVKDASKRIQDFTFEELDELGLMTRLTVMIALRQEALAAAAATPSRADRVAISQLLRRVADWPLSMTLVHQVALTAASDRSEMMRSRGYLHAAYPVVYPNQLRHATNERPVSVPLLYAVMRNESYFYPAAMSSASALGLFQFIPTTFDELDSEWGLLAKSGVSDRRAYLLDSNLSIVLGARWFAEKKLPPFEGNPLLAAMAHHSGDRRVQTWQGIWAAHGWLGDVEMMIETFRQPDFKGRGSDRYGVEARGFAREIAVDLAIADATALYRPAEVPAIAAGR
jgi:peptidoglycan lytic transglycosylase